MTRDELLKCIDTLGFTDEESGCPEFEIPQEVYYYGISCLANLLNGDMDSKWDSIFCFSFCPTFEDGYAITIFPHSQDGLFRGWRTIEANGQFDEVLDYATEMFTQYTKLQISPMWHFLPRAFGPKGHPHRKDYAPFDREVVLFPISNSLPMPW
ncbi:hypothetical protein C8Q79DRAFT_1009668 [Trametes meyenii]|nr:hypothetical protein C8Q79DRAFT_1009668 [Trametes meyenii]